MTACRVQRDSSLRHRTNMKSPIKTPEWKNSVWTRFFIEEAMIGGSGDSNADGYVTLREAFNYGAERAPALTQNQRKGSQHPVLHGGSEVFWFEPPPEPATSNCYFWPIC